MERPEAETTHEAVTNFWYHRDSLRSIWKILSFTAILLVALVLAGVVFYLLPIPHGNRMYESLASFVPIIAATLFGTVLLDKRTFISVGFQFSQGWLRNVSAGIVISACMVSVIVLLEVVFGIVEIRSSGITRWSVVSVFVEGFVLFAFVGLSEETMMRGYPFQVLMRGSNSIVALLVTSVLFAALHLGNPNLSAYAMINIFLAGIWLGCAYLVSGSLWLPIGLHAGWNFTMGTIAGYPVSGLIDSSIFLSIEKGEDWITGGNFGPEGGILSTLVLICGTLLLFNPYTRRRLKHEIEPSNTDKGNPL